MQAHDSLENCSCLVWRELVSAMQRARGHCMTSARFKHFTQTSASRSIWNWPLPRRKCAEDQLHNTLNPQFLRARRRLIGDIGRLP
jgi:hypothetical protein